MENAFYHAKIMFKLALLSLHIASFLSRADISALKGFKLKTESFRCNTFFMNRERLSKPFPSSI